MTKENIPMHDQKFTKDAVYDGDQAQRNSANLSNYA